MVFFIIIHIISDYDSSTFKIRCLVIIQIKLLLFDFDNNNLIIINHQFITMTNARYIFRIHQIRSGFQKKNDIEE